MNSNLKIYQCFINFIGIEMYYSLPEPQTRGRQLQYIRESKGKKHYWGEKGKSYGFYTTNQEIQMEKRFKQHRRLRSEYSHYTDSAQRELNKGKQASLPRVITQPTQTDMDVDYQAPYQSSKHIGISDVNKKLREHLFQKKKQQLSLSTQNVNIQIDLPKQKPQKLPALMINPEQNRGQYINKPNTPLRERLKKEPNPYVVYYTPKDRSRNPTFCNSVSYPLPCYRYIS